MKKSPPRIDFDKKILKTENGTYYLENETLSITRYRIYQDLAIELAQSSTWADNAEAWRKIYKAATSGNDIIKALHIIQTESYNQLNSISQLTEKKYPAIVRFCTLFLNTKEEDTTSYDTKIAQDKMEDWEVSGVPIQDFFLLARTLIDGYGEFLKLLQTLQEEAKKQSGEAVLNSTKKPTGK